MQNHTWLNVLKICSTTSKIQWSSPKLAFCLWKLSEDIIQVSFIFCSFLSKILAASLWQSLPNRSWAPLASLMSSSTLAQLSFTGASQIACENAEDEVTTAGVEQALLPLPLLPLPLAPVPNWLHGLLDMNWLICEYSSLVMLAWSPCKTMELPCFFSIAVGITSSFCIIQFLLVSLELQYFHNIDGIR